jgi:hypothetical protein
MAHLSGWYRLGGVPAFVVTGSRLRSVRHIGCGLPFDRLRTGRPFLNIPFSLWCFIKSITFECKYEIFMKIEKGRV